MSVSADGHTTSTDDYSASTNCHYNPRSGDDNDYPSGADSNSDGHCDPASADNDGDSVDDSDSGSDSKLFES